MITNKKAEDKTMEKKTGATEFIMRQMESILGQMATLLEYSDAVDVDFDEIFKKLGGTIAEKKRAEAKQISAKQEPYLDMDAVVDRVSRETGLAHCCVYRVIDTAFDAMREMGVTGLDLVRAEDNEEDEDEE